MPKLITFLFLCFIAYEANAQNTPDIKPFGKVDDAELNLKQCDFEPDANAEVLFDGGYVHFMFTNMATLYIERHTRIKIFNDKGENYATVRIPYIGVDHIESITKLEAETVNQEDGKPVVTKVDKSQIFDKLVDQQLHVLTFTFPDVKPGAVLDYHYTVVCLSPIFFPNWYFQASIPTKYSEYAGPGANYIRYKNSAIISLPYVKFKKDFYEQITLLAMANLPSVRPEPYMTTETDNMQRLIFNVMSIEWGRYKTVFNENWRRIANDALAAHGFGSQIDKKISGEAEIIKQAETLPTIEERVAYVFNMVKNTMRWSNVYDLGTAEGIAKAWDKKVGSSAEINLIVAHLLYQMGIKSFPMTLSTRNNGKVNPSMPSILQFNTVATYVPIDSVNYFVLDATNKNNQYNIIPNNLLNGFGLSVDPINKTGNLVFLQSNSPSLNSVLLNAEITADGKMQGTAEISNDTYSRIANIDRYKKIGEEKYIDSLREGNNDLKISSLKFQNMAIDSLPLVRDISFSLNLTGSDDKYIYFKPNLLTSFGPNPFLSEKRMTDIDFGHLNNYVITGTYKTPAGFKTDALPKNAKMDMPDKSIRFSRVLSQDGDEITVRYTLVYKKSVFFKENYPEIYDFYKKMYEMLNEPIVLKKG